MNLLITGIHGFLGLNLVKDLKDEHTIYGLDILTSELEGVTKIFSCSELEQIPRVDVVIHLAGKSVETTDLADALDYFETNTGLTRKIFAWFAKSSTKTFVYFSSVKAVADQLYGSDLTEEMEPKPFGVLGESKLLAEKYILEQFVMDKKVYVLRPSIIHGRGSLGNKNMSKLYCWAKSGYPYPFSHFKCRRSLTTMDNLFFVLKRMLELDIPSGIYNVADDGVLSLIEIYEIMCFTLGKKVRNCGLNQNWIRCVSNMGTKFGFYFNTYQYQKLASDFVVSNEKIKKAIGVEKMPVSAVNGLSKSILDYKNK